MSDVTLSFDGVTVKLSGRSDAVLGVVNQLMTPAKNSGDLEDFVRRLKLFCAQRIAIDLAPSTKESRFNEGAAYAYQSIVDHIKCGNFANDSFVDKLYSGAKPFVQLAMQSAGYKKEA